MKWGYDQTEKPAEKIYRIQRLHCCLKRLVILVKSLKIRWINKLKNLIVKKYHHYDDYAKICDSVTLAHQFTDKITIEAYIFFPFQHGLKYQTSWWWKQHLISLKTFCFLLSQYAHKIPILIDGDQQSRYWIIFKGIVQTKGKNDFKQNEIFTKICQTEQG